MNLSRKEALELVARSGTMLQELEEQWKNDNEIVLTAIRNAYYAFEYAGPGPKDNKEVVRTAVQLSGYNLKDVSDRWKADKEIVLLAVNESGDSLRYAAAELKCDREVCLAAVMQDGYAYHYIDKSLQKDREIILAAVQNNGKILKKVPKRVLDEEICLAAIQNYGKALAYVPARLWNRDMYVTAVLCNTHPLFHSYYFWSIPTEYMNVEFYLNAIKQHRSNCIIQKESFPEKWNGNMEDLKQLQEEFRKHPEVQLVEQFYEYINLDINWITYYVKIDLLPKQQWYLSEGPGELLKKLHLVLAVNIDFLYFLDEDVLLVEKMYSFLRERLQKSKYANNPIMKEALENGSPETIISTAKHLIHDKLYCGRI